MLKILLLFLVGYIIYKFCKIASNSDDQKLEDELFLKTYGLEKFIGACERSVSNKNTKLGEVGIFDAESLEV